MVDDWRLGSRTSDSEAIGAMSASGLCRELLELAEPLLDSIGDATGSIASAFSSGKDVLFEGAQGALLDVDHGTYPYVTSSPTTFAGLGNSIGIPSPSVSRRIGVMKAYATRVGEGPFPTELEDDLGDSLRDRGGEFGVTTGRPRRCGWLDLVAVRHALFVNDATEIALTKLDVLAGIVGVFVFTRKELSWQRKLGVALMGTGAYLFI